MPIFAPLAAPALAGVASLFIRFLVGTSIAKVITAFGLGIFNFTALSLITERITGYLTAIEFGASGVVAEVAVQIGFFEALSILLSAWITAVSIRQLRGVFSRLTVGG